MDSQKRKGKEKKQPPAVKQHKSHAAAATHGIVTVTAGVLAEGVRHEIYMHTGPHNTSMCVCVFCVFVLTCDAMDQYDDDVNPFRSRHQGVTSSTTMTHTSPSGSWVRFNALLQKKKTQIQMTQWTFNL